MYKVNEIAQIFDHDEPSREKEAYITVRASDNGQPQLDDACTIKIIIEDINDNQPVFDKVVSINFLCYPFIIIYIYIDIYSKSEYP